jgi:glycine dehydrogenase subunit 1
MYDGPTACAEAALMAARLTSRSKIVVSSSVNPEYRMVTKTYVDSCGLTSSKVQSEEGTVNTSSLTLDQDTACLVVQYPNYFGLLEDLETLAKQAHASGALLVVVTDPISLGLLTPPGEFGADIVVGDAQPCGNFLSFGGPSAGFMACRQEFVRQLPGRLAGMTVDINNKPAFTLTLQTREQHIRRAKATSNICTNQALNALAMLVYLASMGPQGLKQVAEISVKRAHYLAEKLCSIDSVKLAFDKPFFNEFAISTAKQSSHVLQMLKDRGILGGVDLSTFYPELKNTILIAVTEMNTPEQLDGYLSALEQIMQSDEPGKNSLKQSSIDAQDSVQASISILPVRASKIV